MLGTTKTIIELREAVRQRSDMVNNNFITDSELDSYINQSYYELYDLLVQKYGENYYIKSATLTTDGTTSQYSLIPTTFSGSFFGPGSDTDPSVSPEPFVQDFYKLVGVDLKLTPQSGQESWVTVRPFQFADRNRYAVPNMQSFYGLTNLRYRLNGDSLWFTPTPASGQTIRYWYIPRPLPLVASGSMHFRAGSSVDYSGIRIWSDSQFLQFMMNDPLYCDQATGLAIVPAIADAIFSNQNLVSASFDPNQYDQYLSGTGDCIMYLHSGQSRYIRWDTLSQNNSDLGIDPPRNQAWTGVADMVSGWDEYIIVDAAIKCMQKEESDCSVLMAQKQGLIGRIEAAAANRDAGNPPVVSDSQWSDYWLPMGQGGTYGGGGIF